MSKGEFGVPWDKDDNQAVIFDPESGDILFRYDNEWPAHINAAQRVLDCVKACNGIKDPEKTIPKLIELAKFSKKLDEHYLQITDQTPVKVRYILDDINELAKKALEGVSDL